MSHKINRLIKFSQDLFVAWVLIGATWGYFFPKIAASGSGNISIALGVVMLGMGLTITTQQLQSLRKAGRALILGVLLQFTIMPIVGWLAATVLKLPPMLALGVILVGASPGGTASNVVTFLARVDAPTPRRGGIHANMPFPRYPTDSVVLRLAGSQAHRARHCWHGVSF